MDQFITNMSGVHQLYFFFSSEGLFLSNFSFRLKFCCSREDFRTQFHPQTHNQSTQTIYCSLCVAADLCVAKCHILTQFDPVLPTGVIQVRVQADVFRLQVHEEKRKKRQDAIKTSFIRALTADKPIC